MTIVGFSPLGLIVSIAVLAPNLILLWRPPATKPPELRVPPPFEWFERAGQALCLVAPAITVPGWIAWGWAIPAGLALAAYYGLWIRYLAGGRRLAFLYAPVWHVPVPMAILPVAVFLCAAAWLGNAWIAGSAALLAAGHIPVALLTSRAIR